MKNHVRHRLGALNLGRLELKDANSCRFRKFWPVSFRKFCHA